MPLPQAKTSKAQKPKLTTPDAQMLAAIDLLKTRGTITYTQAFLDAIEMRKQNIRGIKQGTHHFTAVQIMRACKEYNLNANWIFGASKDVFVTATVRFLPQEKRSKAPVNARVNAAH